jgi:serpin B
MRKKFISLCLAGAMLLSMTACSTTDRKTQKATGKNTDDTEAPKASTDITENPNLENPTLVENMEKVNWDQFTADSIDFSIALFRQSVAQEESGVENVLIAPGSVLFAMGMTANGAAENTLTEMQAVMWPGMSQEEVNQDMAILNQELTASQDVSFRLANAIWAKEDTESSFQVKEEFTEINSTYYNADTYLKPFDDSTVNEINDWVNTNTNGMIPTLLEEIPDDVVMYLVNAMAFEGEWKVGYEDYEILEDRIFTNVLGEEETVTMLNSQEEYYLEDDSVKGFLKYYEGGEYAFFALIPKDGVTLDSYIEAMTGESYRQLYDNRICTDVEVMLPEFTNDYDIELSESLENMGISDAFHETADFTRMADYEGYLYISRVLHKTHIEVDRTGTRAAAVTAVELVNDECVDIEQEYRSVYLDQPFLYGIIDTDTGIPVFLGVERSIEPMAVMVCE